MSTFVPSSVIVFTSLVLVFWLLYMAAHHFCQYRQCSSLFCFRVIIRFDQHSTDILYKCLKCLLLQVPSLIERTLLFDRVAKEKEVSAGLPNLLSNLKKSWDPSIGLQTKVLFVRKFPSTLFCFHLLFYILRRINILQSTLENLACQQNYIFMNGLPFQKCRFLRDCYFQPNKQKFFQKILLAIKSKTSASFFLRTFLTCLMCSCKTAPKLLGVDAVVLWTRNSQLKISKFKGASSPIVFSYTVGGTNLIYNKPSFASFFILQDPLKLTPYLIIVPSGPNIPHQSTKRNRVWNNQLIRFGKTVTISVPAYRTPEGYVIKHYLEHCISATRSRIKEVMQVPNKQFQPISLSRQMTHVKIGVLLFVRQLRSKISFHGFSNSYIFNCQLRR